MILKVPFRCEEAEAGAREGKAGEGPHAGCGGRASSEAFSRGSCCEMDRNPLRPILEISNEVFSSRTLRYGLRSRPSCGEGRRPLQGLLAGSSPLLRLCLGHMVSRTSAAFASWHPALPSACRLHAGRLTPSLQLPGDLEHWPSWATGTGPGMLMRPEPVQGPLALGALLESWVRHSLEPLCGGRADAEPR